MSTAQDQQSRAAYEDGVWYWVEHEGWHDEPPTIAPALYKAECDAWYSIVFSGIPTSEVKVLEPCERQAARALPPPENVREGEPYDNPAFEDLARTMGVWGTAQAALCAQFFLAGHGAQVAPLTDERIRQLDDATNFHESHTWSIRFARAIEAELRKKVTP